MSMMAGKSRCSERMFTKCSFHPARFSHIFAWPSSILSAGGHCTCHQQISLPHAGEYISPEYVESIIITAPAIEQVFVTGKSSKNAAVAIVVPSPDNADVKRIGRGNLAAFCQSTEGRDLIQAQLEVSSADAKLKVGQRGGSCC